MLLQPEVWLLYQDFYLFSLSCIFVYFFYSLFSFDIGFCLKYAKYLALRDR